MTLRGSVASFPLETIVQLLAATAKTGQLEIRAVGGTGTLGFASGRLVSAIIGDDSGDPALGGVFTLADGEFEFVPWNDPPIANLAGDLSQLLDRAVEQRGRIVADRELITGDRVRFALSDRAASEGDVRLTAEQWKVLLAVNGERDLRGIASYLSVGRLATIAMLADLVRAGIIEVKEAPPEPPRPGPGSGPSGAGGASDVSSFTGTPSVSDQDETRAEATRLAPTVAAAAAEPEKPSWDAPAERDWGLPAQDWETSAVSSTPAWTGPTRAEPVRPDAALNDSLADRIAALEGQESLPPTATPAGDTAIDERLSALSGVFGAPVTPPSWPPAEEPRATALAAPAPVAEPQPEAPPAEEPKKKGGLFSGLFKKEEAQARVERPTMVGLIAQTGTRVTKLAAFANALLDEFNNGQYGKGRVDDRIANLLMRVDEQADPIDRPLPIVDDRIDVSTLERASMSERQVAPYLALLISQIYEDAEHAFGKEKAKRGFKTVQGAVVGDPAELGTDLRLPRV